MISSRKLLDDCFLHDKDRLRHGEALALLQQRISTVVGSRDVALNHAAGHVLAGDVRVVRDIPAFDNAAVDGFALALGSLSGNTDTWLPVSGRSAAGGDRPRSLERGTAVRIFTGAPVPDGADTVIMQEDATTEIRDGKTGIIVPQGVKGGINLRKAGEDQKQGALLLSAGTLLRPFEVAALASAGLAQVTCYEPLRIALLSTGDEVVRPGQPLRPGQVYDANHFLLGSLLGTVRCDVTDLGIVPDNKDAVRKVLLDAAVDHHLIMSTGGASRGEEDHVVATLNETGRLHAWQLAVKPGRPLAFGQLGDCVFLGLPGNPVAVAVCFLLYGRPVCAALGGAPWPEPRRFMVKAGFSMDKKPLRREFLRGWLETDNTGQQIVRKFPRDGSGLISSLLAARGLIELDEETTIVEEGGEVAFIPMSEFGIVQF